MKDEKILLQERTSTSDSSDALCPKGERGVPAVFFNHLELEADGQRNVIDVIEAQTVVVLPTVYECAQVPEPEGIQ